MCCLDADCDVGDLCEQSTMFLAVHHSMCWCCILVCIFPTTLTSLTSIMHFLWHSAFSLLWNKVKSRHFSEVLNGSDHSQQVPLTSMKFLLSYCGDKKMEWHDAGCKTWALWKQFVLVRYKRHTDVSPLWSGTHHPYKHHLCLPLHQTHPTDEVHLFHQQNVG